MRQTVLTLVHHRCCRQVYVPSGLQHQSSLVILYIHAHHTVDAGAFKMVLSGVTLCRAGGGGQVNIPSGHRQQAVRGLQQPAGTVNVCTCGQADICPLNGAGLVMNVFRAELHGLFPGQLTAVKQVTIQFHHHIPARNQRTGTVHITGFYAGIHLRDLYCLRTAVRQRYRGVNQPDNVTGQQRHLLSRQRHTWCQIVLLAKCNTRIH